MINPPLACQLINWEGGRYATYRNGIENFGEVEKIRWEERAV